MGRNSRVPHEGLLVRELFWQPHARTHARMHARTHALDEEGVSLDRLQSACLLHVVLANAPGLLIGVHLRCMGVKMHERVHGCGMEENRIRYRHAATIAGCLWLGLVWAVAWAVA